MKKKVSKISNNGAFGISGFTLGIAGFVSLLLNPILPILFFITGLVFCIIQQKKENTRLGKIGIIINSIGIVATIIYVVILIKYIIPKILELQEQFPVI